MSTIQTTSVRSAPMMLGAVDVRGDRDVTTATTGPGGIAAGFEQPNQRPHHPQVGARRLDQRPTPGRRDTSRRWTPSTEPPSSRQGADPLANQGVGMTGAAVHRPPRCSRCPQRCPVRGLLGCDGQRSATGDAGTLTNRQLIVISEPIRGHEQRCPAAEHAPEVPYGLFGMTPGHCSLCGTPQRR